MSDQIPHLKDIFHSQKIPFKYIVALLFMAALVVGAIVANLVIL